MDECIFILKLCAVCRTSERCGICSKNPQGAFLVFGQQTHCLGNIILVMTKIYRSHLQMSKAYLSLTRILWLRSKFWPTLGKKSSSDEINECYFTGAQQIYEMSSLRTGNQKESLFGVLNYTKTSTTPTVLLEANSCLLLFLS